MMFATKPREGEREGEGARGQKEGAGRARRGRSKRRRSGERKRDRGRVCTNVAKDQQLMNLGRCTGVYYSISFKFSGNLQLKKEKKSPVMGNTLFSKKSVPRQLTEFSSTNTAARAFICGFDTCHFHAVESPFTFYSFHTFHSVSLQHNSNHIIPLKNISVYTHYLPKSNFLFKIFCNLIFNSSQLSGFPFSG